MNNEVCILFMGSLYQESTVSKQTKRASGGGRCEDEWPISYCTILRVVKEVSGTVTYVSFVYHHYWI